MAKITVNQNRISDTSKVTSLCPFGAIELIDGKVEINSACKMCRLCIKNGPEGAFEFVEDKIEAIDKSKWRGIVVYVDHVEGQIHPVTMELIGKAKEMAKKIDHPVYCLFMGHNIRKAAKELLHYGVDEVFVYDYSELENFRIEPYAAAFEDFIDKNRPSIALVGGTTIGRSLAPRVAARFRTGLTADCTILDVQENTDLDQIRPAFGGNIMAHIYTPNHRPQFATVRYKIFSAPQRGENPSGKITVCDMATKKLHSDIDVIEVRKKIMEKGIEEAEAIVVAGRAIKKEEDLSLINELADLLGAKVAVTRPLIESGWEDAKKQIGLSGRTVKPKLIITCGVSGAIQFVAGMNNSECIISIDKDKNAPIFNVAHYGIIGDVYEVVPRLIENIKSGKGLIG
ncbi:electron transfer flavoprotein alpha subunit apoprotein [Peptoclostridium litorale DSM 5388]|uniref:Electron transfer flavoprotein subunit alpha n=1 Tax=Peptoclostridium litorale DSM 5388 TaxID=1121324 RepID=A0A069RCS9_PEPLI|nr:FAD-binding protein [Peptoclostridium litorale]KDR94050.1 electron transfer flavoprotein subunit alpha [Peptoclostridium litorale DSM 5388]SIN80165.1 electron transfer flavoprotein alpha subunit apoprotein [Peptoclostridium litorale DSM 5388]